MKWFMRRLICIVIGLFHMKRCHFPGMSACSFDIWAKKDSNEDYKEKQYDITDYRRYLCHLEPIKIFSEEIYFWITFQCLNIPLNSKKFILKYYQCWGLLWCKTYHFTLVFGLAIPSWEFFKYLIIPRSIEVFIY